MWWRLGGRFPKRQSQPACMGNDSSILVGHTVEFLPVVCPVVCEDLLDLVDRFLLVRELPVTWLMMMRRFSLITRLYSAICFSIVSVSLSTAS